MNDKMLVERVIAWLDGGCSSWNVPSSDIRQMATRIEALEAEIRRYMGVHGVLTQDDRDRLKQALESQP
jgi:hypothetical protein